jgi:hypothetical protein
MTGDSRPGSVGSGRRPSPEATRSALDGFRATPDTRKAGMSHLIIVASGRPGRRVRASGAPRPERGAGSAVAAERSAAALDYCYGLIRQLLPSAPPRFPPGVSCVCGQWVGECCYGCH